MDGVGREACEGRGQGVHMRLVTPTILARNGSRERESGWGGNHKNAPCCGPDTPCLFPL